MKEKEIVADVVVKEKIRDFYKPLDKYKNIEINELRNILSFKYSTKKIKAKGFIKKLIKAGDITIDELERLLGLGKYKPK